MCRYRTPQVSHGSEMDGELTSHPPLDLFRTCARSLTADALLDGAVPLVHVLAGAHAVRHSRPAPGGAVLVRSAGTALPEEVVDTATGPPSLWARQGVTRVTAHQLPGDFGTLVLAWAEQPAPAQDELDTALEFIDAALARFDAEERFADLSARVDNAQQLANMGDYDWHIATDTNRWSDQLYRIYGHEPQSFNATYERFLSHIHPDDRERITGIHRAAYESGEPYEMVERIVRPDGSTRYLASNGQVIRDDTNTPVRMRGTCIDITDRVHAEQERERVAARFRSLVEASPDAILLLDNDEIVQANGRASELLNGDPVGHQITTVLPGGLAAGRAAQAATLNGGSLLLDVVTEPIERDAGAALSAVFLRDAQPRLHSESIAATLREVKVRRRQALEMNDNVVQALSAATYALDEPDIDECGYLLGRALAGARHLMNDWLSPPDGTELKAGDLVRAAGSTITTPSQVERKPAAQQEAAASSSHLPRIVIVDDNDDLRRLLRIQIERLGRYNIVGEGVDGVDAIDVVTETQPDVVFLDLAMPRMDGLEALPLILQAAPGVRVVVLSGFDQGTIAAKALAAGAVRYVEKGMRLDFAQIIDDALAVTSS
jgi:PAS domain S-box-containing protein